MNVSYYPSLDDHMWNTEMSKLLPYVGEKNLDIGCGGRTISKDFLRLDLDPEWDPEILAPADNTGLDRDAFDFISATHLFEHLPNQEMALKEWLRILKPKGFIGIIHPDVDFTGIQKGPEANEHLKKHPLYKHEKEQNHISFIKWIMPRTKFGFTVIDHGIACGNWSFYCILRKN